MNTTWIPEMLGRFLNMNKIKTKRISNHMRQHFIHNRTWITKQMFKLRNTKNCMHKMSSFHIWCLLQKSKLLGWGHVYHGVASPLLFKIVWRRLGIEVMSFWSFGFGIWSHSCLIWVSICWRVCGHLWRIFNLMMRQMFSIGERSGLQAGLFYYEAMLL